MHLENSDYKISRLEEYKGSLRVLIKLRELEGKSYSTELNKLLGLNVKTIRNIRGKLLSAKLIFIDEQFIEENRKYRIYLVLTEKGTKIADLAAKIEEELQKE